MNPFLGWGLAALCVALAYVQWGWRGALLGLTLVVFWLLRQFSRTLRAMRHAAHAPVGHVDSAVMLHSKLHAGMRLIDIIPLARSLGAKVADDPETFVWRDASGAGVRVAVVGGRCTVWELSRPTDQSAA